MEFGIDLPESKPFDAVGFGLNAIDHLVLVPRYPEFNTKTQFVSSKLSPGGQVATAMVALARLGLKARYIGSIGSDELGAIQLESLRSEGVEIAGVRVVEGAESQTAFIVIDQESGERTILWRRDPLLEYNPDELDPAIITSARVLHLDGHDVPASIRAAEIAKSAGIPVAIDIDNIYPGVDRLLPLIDFLIASSTFPERMTGESDLKSGLKKLND
ncbi:MAG: carbohydrate kinase family protein, partial [Blastocatellia bacterium]